VDQNVIADNAVPGMFLITTTSKALVRRNVFRNNVEDPSLAARGWGGLGTQASYVVMENNLFEHNVGSQVGGAYLQEAESNGVTVRNNSFVENSGPYASALLLTGANNTPMEITSNLFDDESDVAEIDCWVNEKIGRNNVFAASSAPAFAGSCSFAP
jgi:hypothetical protein